MEKEQSFKDTEAKDKDKEEASLREEISEMGQGIIKLWTHSWTRH